MYVAFDDFKSLWPYTTDNFVLWYFNIYIFLKEIKTKWTTIPVNNLTYSLDVVKYRSLIINLRYI